MAKLTTHVLDTALGIPVAGINVDLYQQQDEAFVYIKTLKTNQDGRCDASLLSDEALIETGYELVFDVEQYFNNCGVQSPFLKKAVVRFHISDNSQNYHVPLLVSPFSYSTYRGS